ncbi:DUF7266 family protein [Salinarchaeum laminariae]|uniref:DUF7266 family protein n=1 Tax=Salinarchaeum laminariae TaxID=869888 RepID=UPI0020C0A2CD|nr:hypothetical protein [Salinarchaeum laminariae]
MTDERGVSITVTHVMTIGITTILIAGLLLGAGNMLEDQRRNTGDQELRTIGDRVATELVTAADRGNRTSATVLVRSSQPGSSVGGSYRVTLTDSTDCYQGSGYDGCLELNAFAENIDVEVPVSLPDGVSVEGGSAQGGRIVSVYNHSDYTVTIRGDGT